MIFLSLRLGAVLPACQFNWQIPMNKTDWYPPHAHPTRRGLYERDWRGTDVLPEEDRRITLDFLEPVMNPRDALYPGIWYVLPEYNEASRESLPWRGITKA